MRRLSIVELANSGNSFTHACLITAKSFMNSGVIANTLFCRSPATSEFAVRIVRYRNDLSTPFSKLKVK